MDICEDRWVWLSVWNSFVACGLLAPNGSVLLYVRVRDFVFLLTSKCCKIIWKLFLINTNFQCKSIKNNSNTLHLLLLSHRVETVLCKQ